MNPTLRTSWSRWVALWRGEEAPWSLALVRVLLGAVILWDFVEMARLGLVVALFGVHEVGGLSDALARDAPPMWVRVFGGGEGSARALHAVITLSAASFLAGFFSRTSAVLLLLSWAQFAHLIPAADRGIDTLCRDVLLIFVFAQGGGALSVDAWLRTGRLSGDGRPIPAWPRRLLVLQLVAMYFLAGIQKVGVHWWPPGHYAALYFILQDPAIARFDFSWLRGAPWFQLSQLASFVTIVFQDTYPVVLLLRWARADPTGFRAHLAPYAHLEWIWIGLGAAFHLLLAATCELGIFPWAMLALYPAWLAPEKWAALVGQGAGAVATPLN